VGRAFSKSVELLKCNIKIRNRGAERSAFWGAHAPSRADCGALAAMNLRNHRKTNLPAGKGSRGKVRDDEGVIASPRGRVRSPNCCDHPSPLRSIHLLHCTSNEGRAWHCP
jgi:hypothetical protein